MCYGSDLACALNKPDHVNQYVQHLCCVFAGKFDGPPIFTATYVAAQYLTVDFEYSNVLWPWSGFLALYIRVLPEAAAVDDVASGDVAFQIVSPPAPGEKGPRRSKVTFPVKVKIIPTPPR